MGMVDDTLKDKYLKKLIKYIIKHYDNDDRIIVHFIKPVATPNIIEAGRILKVLKNINQYKAYSPYEANLINSLIRMWKDELT